MDGVGCQKSGFATFLRLREMIALARNRPARPAKHEGKRVPSGHFRRRRKATRSGKIDECVSGSETHDDQSELPQSLQMKSYRPALPGGRGDCAPAQSFPVNSKKWRSHFFDRLERPFPDGRGRFYAFHTAIDQSPRGCDDGSVSILLTIIILPNIQFQS
jgi:hypothetical protein